MTVAPGGTVGIEFAIPQSERLDSDELFTSSSCNPGTSTRSHAGTTIAPGQRGKDDKLDADNCSHRTHYGADCRDTADLAL
jgi:hypothetical protein